MFEYLNYFGGPPPTQFDIGSDLRTASLASINGVSTFTFAEPGAGAGDPASDSYIAHQRYYLYYAMRLFFDNGGGACYIVCIGFYRTPVAIRASELENGLDLLTAYQEPTMIAVPDVASLSRQDAASLSQQVLKHCSTRKSRVAILDIFPGETAINHNDPIGKFRDGIGEVGLDFGAAYYPWIETSVVEADEINAGFLTRKALGKVVEKVNAYIKAMPDQKSKDALSGFLSVVAPTASSGAPRAPAGGGDAQPGRPTRSGWRRIRHSTADAPATECA